MRCIEAEIPVCRRIYARKPACADSESWNANPGGNSSGVTGDSIPTAVAMRAMSPPKLGGRDDDAAWQIAPTGDEFND